MNTGILILNALLMIYDYLVILKDERGKYVNPVSILLCFISAAFFLVQYLKSGNQAFIFLLSCGLIAGGLSLNGYLAIKKKRPVYYNRVLLVAGVTWFAMPWLEWIGVAVLLLAFLEKHARSPLEIGVTDDRIVFNTLIRKKFHWENFSNVMLKDGILTLDFKNNRLFQKETIEETGAALELEFNEYCRKHLTKPDPEG